MSSLQPTLANERIGVLITIAVPLKWSSAIFGFVSFGWGRLSGCGEALRICRGSLL